IAGDVTVTKLTSTSPSGVVGDSVKPVDGTAREFFYNLQLIGNTFFMENDIAILGLRYADATTSNTYSVLVNTRFPYTRNFKINPRMRLDFRHKIKEDRFRVLPSLRMNYRWRKTIWFDTDFRLDWDESLTDKEDSTRSFSLSFSYRVEF
ncbi:MAG: hypothetical protein ACE5FU_09250, partial [Nitrospinota bacterium]